MFHLPTPDDLKSIARIHMVIALPIAVGHFRERHIPSNSFIQMIGLPQLTLSSKCDNLSTPTKRMNERERNTKAQSVV